MKPDFNLALQNHFDAIANRDIESFKAHLSQNPDLYTIVQNGHAFVTREETIAIHTEWFKDPHWTWEGTVINTAVGADMAMALVKYTYRPRPEAASFETWLTYVFALEGNQWKIIHDHNTALDYAAFARAQGL